MDGLRGTQGVTGAYNWGTTTASPKPAVLPQEAPLSAGDHFESALLPSAMGLPLELPTSVPVEVPTRLPSVEIPRLAPGTGSYVPTFLAGDQFDFSIGNAPSAPAGSHAVSSLGVLAQLDEPTATTSVRAIDNQPRMNPFSDMHVVGPGNAQQFLGNPSALYLGM